MQMFQYLFHVFSMQWNSIPLYMMQCHGPVTGNVYLRDGYITSRLREGDDEIFNVNELRDDMQLLLQDPFIERLNAELAPGVEPGQAELHVDVEEDRPFQLFATADNHTSPSVGA